MARTLGEIKQWATTELHEDPTDTDFLANVAVWTRQGINKIVTYTDWKWNTGLVELTWPAATGEYSVLYLPEYVDKILSLFPGANEGIGSVVIYNAWELDRYRPGVGTLLGRDYLVLFGRYWVEADMPAAGAIDFASDAGAAGNDVQILIEGRSNGRQVREIVTLAGLGVGASAYNYDAGPDGVRRIALVGGTGAGTGVITATSGGADLAVLDSAWEKFQQHVRTELYAGTSTTTYTCRYYRRHRRVQEDADFIDLPEEFDDILELYLAAKIGRFRNRIQDEHVSYMAEFNARLHEMIGWDNRQPGQKNHLRLRRQWPMRRLR